MRVLPRISVAADDVRHRIDQQLGGEPYAGIAAGDRGRRGQIAAGAVAGNAKSLGIAAKFRDAVEDIAGRGEGVLEGAGKARFGWTPIVDRDDDRAGLDREIARLPVVSLEIARDPAAAVEEHHRRRSTGADPVDARIEQAGAGMAERAAASARKESRARCGVIVVGSRSGSSGMIWAMTGSSGAAMAGPLGLACGLA